MSSVLKTACGWTRHYHEVLGPDGLEGDIAEYEPGSLSVEYRTGDNGKHKVVRVLGYVTRWDIDLPYVRHRFQEIPPPMREQIARIIHENERNYGRWVSVIRLPGGEVIRVAG